MILNLEIVRVDSDYCDYLRQFDNKVAYNKHEKELRPFIGILFEVDLNKETLTIAELKYQKLLKEQLSWLNAHYRQVKNKSFKLYQLYNSGKLPDNMKLRCCNFKLLEEKCLEYNKVK